MEGSLNIPNSEVYFDKKDQKMALLGFSKDNTLCWSSSDALHILGMSAAQAKASSFSEIRQRAQAIKDLNVTVYPCAISTDSNNDSGIATMMCVSLKSSFDINARLPFFESSEDAMSISEYKDGALKVVRMNGAAKKLFGVTVGPQLEILNQEYKTPDQIKELWNEKMELAARTGQTVRFEYSRMFGETKRILYNTINLVDRRSDGTAMLACVFQDVTDIRNFETKLRAVQDFVRIGTWEVNPSSNILKWSDSMFDIYGVKDRSTPMTTERFEKIIHPDDLERVKSSIAKLAANAEEHSIEFRVVDSDNQIRWIEGRGHAFLDSTGNVSGLMGVAIDISERKKSEHLIQQQHEKILNLAKMSALGEMAAGIAHEINNPLTILRGNHLLVRKELKKEVPDVAKLAKSLKNNEETVSRIETIVNGLGFFARDDQQDPLTWARLDDIVSDTVGFCRPRLDKHGIRLKIDLVTPHLKIKCRPVQISQVLLNLLNNACDAIELNKTKDVLIQVKKVKNNIHISVLDSGDGIEEENLNRLFLPFFSTKKAGKGIGLGLGISKGIVESYGGTIEYSRENNFTKFEVLLRSENGSSN